MGYRGLGDYQIRTALKNVQNVSKWCKESLQILAGLCFRVLAYWGSLGKNYTEKWSKSVKIVRRILVNSLLVWTWCFGDDQM
jgi:hypothetical protein